MVLLARRTTLKLVVSLGGCRVLCALGSRALSACASKDSGRILVGPQQKTAGVMSSKGVSEQGKAAVLGGLVADSATMGLHWIYDITKIEALLKDNSSTDEPEFFSPPACPFYQYKAGALSPYGHEALGALKFFSEAGEDWSGQSYAQFLKDWYTAYEADQGRLNHSWKTLVKNVQDGAQYPHTGDPADTQADAIVVAAIVAAIYAGKPDLSKTLETAIRVQQDNDYAVKVGVAAGLILEKVILGSSIQDALSWAEGRGAVEEEVRQQIQEGLAKKQESFTDTVAAIGLSCALPGAFQNVLVGATTLPDYVTAIRANILAGGDNCSRSIYLGALLAAAGGSNAVPQSWVAQVTKGEEIQSYLAKL